MAAFQVITEVRWYEVDMNWYGIWVLKVLGLAKQIKVTQLAPLLPGDLSASKRQLTPMSGRRSQSAAGD
jgi:hypothetical protein